MLQQDKESAGVLRGFIGQSRLYWAIAAGQRSKAEQGESGSLQPAGSGVTLIYPGGCGSSRTFPYMVRIGL